VHPKGNILFLPLAPTRFRRARRRFLPARAPIHPTIHGDLRIPTARATGCGLLSRKYPRDHCRAEMREITALIDRLVPRSKRRIENRNEEAISMFIESRASTSSSRNNIERLPRFLFVSFRLPRTDRARSKGQRSNENWRDFARAT